jgi:hypothetical protein
MLSGEIVESHEILKPMLTNKSQHTLGFIYKSKNTLWNKQFVAYSNSFKANSGNKNKINHTEKSIECKLALFS